MTHKAWYGFYKDRLTDLLTKYDPSSLETLDCLMSKFPGNEHHIYSEWCKEWKVEPLPKATLMDLVAYRPKHAQVLGIPPMDLDIALDAELDDTLLLVSSEDMNGTNHAIDRESAMMCNLVKNIIEGDSEVK